MVKLGQKHFLTNMTLSSPKLFKKSAFLKTQNEFPRKITASSLNNIIPNILYTWTKNN